MDLVPMNFFRYVKIVLLKMHASGKIFDRICLKADGDSFFFQYRYGVRSEDRGTQFFGAGNIQQKGKVQNFWLAGRPLNSLLYSDILIYLSGKPWGGCLIYLLQWFWKVWVSIFFFKSIYLQHLSLKIKMRWQILRWHSTYWKLSIHFKVRSI